MAKFKTNDPHPLLGLLALVALIASIIAFVKVRIAAGIWLFIAFIFSTLTISNQIRKERNWATVVCFACISIGLFLFPRKRQQASEDVGNVANKNVMVYKYPVIDQYLHQHNADPRIQNFYKLKEWVSFYGKDVSNNDEFLIVDYKNCRLTDTANGSHKYMFSPQYVSGAWGLYSIGSDKFINYINGCGYLRDYKLLFEFKGDEIIRVLPVLFCKTSRGVIKNYTINDTTFDLEKHINLAVIDRQRREYAQQMKTKEQEREREEREQQANQIKANFVENCFSGYDGSCIYLEPVIKQNMNDPDSYEHIATTYEMKKNYAIVYTKFRGRNGFGALVVNVAKAKVSFDCQVLSLQIY